MKTISLTSSRRRVGRLLGLFTLAAIAAMQGSACSNQAAKEEKTPPDGAEISQQVVAEAKVQAIDAQKRLVTLRRDDGSTVVVEAGPAVKNFAQIRVGDTVTARYLESLAVSLKKPDEASAPASAAVVAGAAAPGAKPAGGIGAQVSVTVTIDSVDKEKNLVVFTLPTGEKRVTHVERPEGREFIKGLKAGDRVEITYTEAMAISVETKSPN
jgi:hypothetical protein